MKLQQAWQKFWVTVFVYAYFLKQMAEDQNYTHVQHFVSLLFIHEFLNKCSILFWK